MKRLLILIVFVCYSLIGFAQVRDTVLVFKKNVVKFLPMNIPFHSLSFEYERMIDPNYSLTIGVGLPINGTLSDQNSASGNSNFKSPEFNTMHIRAALRYYYGYHMLPKGFYVEPYLKYQQIRGSAIYEGKDDQNINYSGNLTAKLNTLNLGVQFGVQFLIAKRVTLDFYFLGIEGGLLNGNIISTSENKPADAEKIEADFNDKVSSLPFFIKNWTSVKKVDNQVFIDAKNMQYPWFRGGLSVGIAF